MTAQEIAQALGGRPAGNGWLARCPAHDDHTPSLSITEGPGGKVLVRCHAGCSQEAVIAALRERGLWPTNGRHPASERRIVATYDYTDAGGRLLFQVVRYEPKDFRQRRPDGNGGWIWDLKGVKPVLYHLPDALAAAQAGRRVFVVEGEKDANNLRALGLLATTGPGGAGKWRPEYSQALRGAHVVILPDRDRAGRKHAQAVARSLHALAASLKVLELPGEGKDVSDWLDAGGTREELERLADEAPEWGPEAEKDAEGDQGDAPAPVRLVASPQEPLANARQFVAERYTVDGIETLRHQQESFWGWTGNCYAEVETARVRSDLYEWLEGAAYTNLKGELVPFQPNRTRVDHILDALRAVAHLPAATKAPAWLGEEGPNPAGEIIACRNGLLHVPTRTLLAHTPRFFGTFALPFDYDPGAPEPKEWLTFLHQLWEDEPQAIETLAEAIGYSLTPDTSQQKMFLLVGPLRSGKGTIGRVWRALLGTENIAGPTLGSLASNFGLAPLIGKPLAIISDARLSGRADQQVIVERLLSISGEDAITIDRKHRPHWTGQLPTRIVILTNELPRLGDTSGALANRFIVLRLTRSWLGKEDPKLTGRLLRELPGILNWALAGLERLRERGYFRQPPGGAEAARELLELSSPMSAFVRERCVVGPAYMATVDDLYAAWVAWCEENGREHPGTKQTFGRDLRALLPGLTDARPRVGGEQVRCYQGIGLAIEPVRRGETRLKLLHTMQSQAKTTQEDTAENAVARDATHRVSLTAPNDGEEREAGDSWRPKLGESTPADWGDGRCVRCGNRRWRWSEALHKWTCTGCREDGAWRRTGS